MSTAIVEQRRAANTGEETCPAPQHIRLPPITDPVGKPRQSVKLTLRRLKEGTPQPPRKRAVPER